MSKTKLRPVGDRILLKVEQANLGSLDTSSMKSAVEWGTIVDMGPDVVGPYRIGDKVFVKAWSIDSILYEGEDYYFTSESLKGICAVVA